MFWKSVFKGGFLSVFTDKITKYVVPVGGLEPPHIAIPDFESGVSTISPHWHVFGERNYRLPLLKES